MKILGALLLATTLLAQSREKVLWIRGPKDTEVVRSSIEEVLSQKEICELIEPVLIEAGYKIASEEEATSTTSGEALYVFPKAMKDGESVRGLIIQINLQNAQIVAKGKVDPQILTQRLWIPKIRGVVHQSLNFRRVTLQMVTAVLSKRVGHPLQPVNLLGGKDIELSPVYQGPGGYVGGPVGSTDQSEYEDPRIIYRPKALEYPVVARMARITGVVVVHLSVNPSGVPALSRATEGPAELQKAAEEFALQVRFEPGKCDGKPMWSQFTLKIPFTLNSKN